MLGKHKAELDDLMSLYSQDAAALKQKREAEKATQERFAAEFERLKREVIWPALIDIGNQLTRYGHDFHESEEKEYIDATAFYHPTSVTFNIYPATINKAMCKPESTPYIAFIADRYAKKVIITVSTMMPDQGGVVGEHGVYETNQITPELVEKEVIAVLKNSLILHQ